MRLADRIAEALATSEGTGPSADDYHSEHYAEAAVLVAITDRPEPGVIMTLRQPHLRRHAGQIAFPGGRMDPEDANAVAAALREAHEEIALAPDLVEVIGVSDRYRSGSGFDIVPVIGIVPPEPVLVPHEPEVADVFEVPLAFLLETGNHARRATEWKGRSRTYYEIVWGERRIWGITAGIIVNLSTRLACLA